MSVNNFNISTFEEVNLDALYLLTEEPNLAIALNNLFFNKVLGTIGKPIKSSDAEMLGSAYVNRHNNAFFQGATRLATNVYALLRGFHVFQVGATIGGLGDLINEPDKMDIKNQSDPLVAEMVAVSQALVEALRLIDDADEFRHAIEAAVKQKPTGSQGMPPTGFSDKYLDVLPPKLINSATLQTEFRRLLLLAEDVTDVLT